MQQDKSVLKIVNKPRLCHLSHPLPPPRLAKHSVGHRRSSQVDLRPLSMSANDARPPNLFSMQPVLNAVPLTSVPYIPPSTKGLDAQSLAEDTPWSEGKVGPMMVYFPSHTIQKERSDVLMSAGGVVLSGSAALGKIGPAFSLMDIGESADFYMFRVALPGVSRNESNFSWLIKPDGEISISGVTTTGETTVCKNSRIFKMISQNLCPPGPFSITFQLPGPVQHELFKGHFGMDGIFEGVVKKR